MNESTLDVCDYKMRLFSGRCISSKILLIHRQEETISSRSQMDSRKHKYQPPQLHASHSSGTSPRFLSLSLDRRIAHASGHLFRDIHLSLHRVLSLLQHADVSSLRPALPKPPITQLLVHRRCQRNHSYRRFPSSLARPHSLRLRGSVSLFGRVLSSLRLLQSLPIPTTFIASLSDSHSAALSKAGTFRSNSRTRLPHAPPHSAPLLASPVLSRRE